MTPLKDSQISQYQTDGFICPVPVMSAVEAGALRSKLETFKATQGGKLDPPQRNKSHLLF